MTTTSTDRRNGVNIGSAVKVPCRAATTGNIVLSGNQSIDGVACVTGDRILVKDQTSGINNGIYVCDTSAWKRSKDWDGSGEVKKGTLIFVSSGTLNKGFWYVNTSDPIIPGTTNVSIVSAPILAITVSAYWQTVLDDLNSNASLTTLTSTRSETGAVAVTVLNKLQEIISVKDFGAVGDRTTNDTVAITNAINAANALDSTASASMLYFPKGSYAVVAGSLPTINCNVYGPEASVIAFDATDSPIMVWDDRASGRSFCLRGIFGYKYLVATDWQLTANQKGIGLKVVRGEHSKIDIQQLEGLSKAISLDGTTGPYHIGEITGRFQSILHNLTGISLSAGSNLQCEANRFFINYFNNNGTAISLTNAGGGGNGLCVNNHFDVLAMELHARDDLIGIALAGTTVSQTRANTFIIRESLSTPTGTGKMISCAAGILNNYFELCYCDFSKVTMDAGNIFNLATHEMNVPGSTAIDARSQIYRGTTPASGYWKQGDIVFNNAAAAGTNAGWVCTVSGSPGTWKSFGPVDLQGSATWDPGSIANGAKETKNVTVTGAVLNDFAIASFSLDLAGLAITAQVTAADVVSVILLNNSGGAIDLGSGTVKARVIKQ